MNKKQIIAFVLVLLALIIADTLWFILSLDRLYKPIMGDLLAPKPNLYAALGFYLVYGIGLCHFIIFPRLSNAIFDLKILVRDAAIFGFVAFATYDLTALSVIKDFSAKLAFIDMLWGISAATISCLFTVLVTRKLVK